MNRQMVLDMNRQKNEFEHIHHTIYSNKVNTDWRLKLRAKIIKLFQEYTDGNLHYFGLGNSFLDLTPKAQPTKR